MRATQRGSGALQELPDCYVNIPGATTILLKSLPEIGDTKNATYNDEFVIGRSFPLKTYAHSDNRSITMTLQFYTVGDGDIAENLTYLRAIESACYPREGTGGAPFIPPPVCQLKCGQLLGSSEICAVLRSYSVRFPTDVPWDVNQGTYLPYKFSVETSWEVVYETANLPGQERIFNGGS